MAHLRGARGWCWWCGGRSCLAICCPWLHSLMAHGCLCCCWCWRIVRRRNMRACLHLCALASSYVEAAAATAIVTTCLRLAQPWWQQQQQESPAAAAAHVLCVISMRSGVLHHLRVQDAVYCTCIWPACRAGGLHGGRTIISTQPVVVVAACAAVVECLVVAVVCQSGQSRSPMHVWRSLCSLLFIHASSHSY